MENIRILQKITGQERKVIASVVATALDSTAVYAGAPTFAYSMEGWCINKSSELLSPHFNSSNLSEVQKVVEALGIAGLKAEGALSISMEGFTEKNIQNLRNILASKVTLMKHALQTDCDIAFTANESIVSLSFFKETLNTTEVMADITLVAKLGEFAKTLKRVSAIERPVVNEKYAFRCFLLRLGFIGPEYKVERKILLAPLEGSAAFKNGIKLTEVTAE